MLRQLSLFSTFNLVSEGKCLNDLNQVWMLGQLICSQKRRALGRGFRRWSWWWSDWRCSQHSSKRQQSWQSWHEREQELTADQRMLQECLPYSPRAAAAAAAAA